MHAEEVMRLIVVRNGRRWRCIRSIEAAKKPVPERDAFGRKVSDFNLQMASSIKNRRVCYDD
jgi:hypothetical protein